MIRFVADENFNRLIVRGLVRRLPIVEVARVQDIGLRGATDPAILAWASANNLVLLTHDVNTITRYVGERAAEGLDIPGVVVVRHSCPIGKAIDELVLLIEALQDDEWTNRLWFVPL